MRQRADVVVVPIESLIEPVVPGGALATARPRLVLVDGQVGYVIRGRWKYVEHDWIAEEGSDRPEKVSKREEEGKREEAVTRAYQKEMSSFLPFDFCLLPFAF